MKNTLLPLLACITLTSLSQNALAQFDFRFVQSTGQIMTIEQAGGLLDGDNVAFEQSAVATVFDLVDGDSFNSGLFDSDLDVLGIPGVDDNDFAIELIGELVVDQAGAHTFGINLDDGGRIRIDAGNGLQTVVERPTGGATDDFYGELFFDTPGNYSICLLYTSPSPRDKRQSRMPSSA